MKNLYPTLRKTMLAGLVAVITVFSACQEEDNPTFPDDLRVLKVTSDEDNLEDGAQVNKANFGLVITFSHSLNTTAFEEAFTVEGTTVNLTYDESNSIVTVDLPSLDFESNYQINLPEGAYGADGENLKSGFSLNFSTLAFVPPSLTVEASQTEMVEGESIEITTTIDQVIELEVSFDLALTGSAILDTDYTISTQTLTIPAGETTATATLTSLNDGGLEGEELITIGFENVVNADASSGLNISLFDQLPKLQLKGVMEFDNFNMGAGRVRAIQLLVTEDIDDLSTYSIGVANNGGGTDGIEYTFPQEMASAGDHILLVRDLDAADAAAYFASCFQEFDRVIETSAMTQNGNDAIELFEGDIVVETFGDPDVDGTGMEWEYTDSWAYKLGDEWIYGGVGCVANATETTTTQTSNCEYPFCSAPLQLQGLTSFEIGGTTTNGRSIHLRANKDIPDLSIYNIGIANNGGGSDGMEISFPSQSVSEGEHILFVRDIDVETLTGYFGACANKFDYIIPNPQGENINFNGDDPVELFKNGAVIETYGDVALDGTGEVWEWTQSWAFKEGSVWSYGGVGCASNVTSNDSSPCPYPYCD